MVPDHQAAEERAVHVNHGFSLYPINVNFQVVPGYDYGLRVTPNASGDFRIMCNEFCGIGHHVMVGRVIVDAQANEGPTIKRYRPRAQGRAFPIHKPMTHITIVVEDREA